MVPKPLGVKRQNQLFSFTQNPPFTCKIKPVIHENEKRPLQNRVVLREFKMNVFKMDAAQQMAILSYPFLVETLCQIIKREKV